VVLVGLTEIRYAVWVAVSKVIKQHPSLAEIAERAGVPIQTAGKAMQWLRCRRVVDWNPAKKRSYRLLVKPLPRRKAN